MKYLKPASAGRGPRRRYAVSAYVATLRISRLMKRKMSSLESASRLIPRAAEEQERVELAALGVAPAEERRRRAARTRPTPMHTTTEMRLPNGSSTAKPRNTSDGAEKLVAAATTPASTVMPTASGAWKVREAEERNTSERSTRQAPALRMSAGQSGARSVAVSVGRGSMEA